MKTHCDSNASTHFAWQSISRNIFSNNDKTWCSVYTNKPLPEGWSNDGPVQWCIYAWPDLNELISKPWLTYTKELFPQLPNTSDSNLTNNMTSTTGTSEPQTHKSHFRNITSNISIFWMHISKTNMILDKRSDSLIMSSEPTSNFQTVFLNILERLEDLPSSFVSHCYSQGNWTKTPVKLLHHIEGQDREILYFIYIYIIC